MEPKNRQLKRKIIFQTPIFGFHVNFPGCKSHRSSYLVAQTKVSPMIPFDLVGKFSLREQPSCSVPWCCSVVGILTLGEFLQGDEILFEINLQNEKCFLRCF